MNEEDKLNAKELIDRYYWVFGDGYLGDLHKRLVAWRSTAL